MKKLLALVLAAIMCLSVLAACNDNNNGGNATTAGATTAAPTPNETTGPAETTGSDSTTGSQTTGGDVTPPAPEYDVEAAKEYLKSIYKSYLTANETAADFSLVSQVMVAGTAYTVTWSTNTDKVTVVVNDEDKTVTVDVNEKATEKLDYVLTATVADPDGATAELSFNLVVPAFAVLSYDEYIATEKDKAVVVAGIVTAVSAKSEGNSKNQIYVQTADNKGGYYVYTIAEDKDPVKDLGIQAGMTVTVTGTKDIYSGLHEIKDASIEIVDPTIKTVAPIDITEAFAAASDNKDANLVNKLAMLVTIKGVTIGDQDLTEKSQYYYFELNGTKTYIRIYDNDLPVVVTDADKAALIEKHTNSYGYTADITGVVIVYSGVFYLNPVSADSITNLQLPTRTDAEKVELELGATKIPAKLTSDSIIQLPLIGATYEDVKFAWISDSTNAVIGADGKMTVTVPNEKVIVTLTATVTIGEITKTQTYTIELSKEATPLSEVIAIGGALASGEATEEKYLVQGVIDEIYNEEYGNAYIIDANGNRLLVYGIKDAEGNKYNAMATKPVVGDFVTFLSVISNHNGTAQLKNAVPVEIVSPTSIPDATKIGTDLGVNNATSDKMHLVTGVIIDDPNATYGNCNIQDADGNTIYIYGLYDATGAVKYDKLTNKPVKGDTITVYSYVSYYNNPQLKNARVVAIIAGNNGGTDDPVTPPTGLVSIADALAAADGTEVTVKGTVVKVSEWNEKYGDMNVTISDGTNELFIYACKKEVAVGDTLTVKGNMGTHNGSRQIGLGSTVIEHIPAGGGTDDPVTPPTPPTPPVGDGKIADILAGAADVDVTFTGTISGIYQAFDAGYKNVSVYVTDETGTILAFRMVATSAEDYCIGDVITVTGKTTTYNNTIQIAQGCTAVMVTRHECEYKDATCTSPKTCKNCGKTEGAALGHTEPNAEGKCGNCGEDLTTETQSSAMTIYASTGTLNGDKTTITWENDVFTVENNQGESTSAIRTQDSNHFRCYKYSDFAVFTNNGEVISKIVIKGYGEAKYKDAIKNSAEAAGYKVTVDGDYYTIVGDNTDSIAFTASANQFRFCEVTVYYVE